MKLSKPKFWLKKNSFVAIILYPLAVLLLFFIYLKKKVTEPIKFKIPILCVGNIYLGGTGKTPASILIAQEFTKCGYKPVVLRKFYKNHSDEHNLIRANFENLILCRDRVDGIKNAEKQNFDCAILDDGFQDYKVKKDLSVICFNEKQLIGNGFTLPSGPLRNNLNSLKEAHVILINGKKNEHFEKKLFEINKKLDIFYSFYKPINIEDFKNKKLLAIAGIGNPENFFQLLEENELIIGKKLVFPDHYQFSKNEFENIIIDAKNNNYEIVMTEKDYYKVKNLNLSHIKYLKIELQILEKEKFFKKISEIHGKKN